MINTPTAEATSRLATVAVGDLRAARACVDVTHDRIAVALHKHDARLEDVPPGQLIELSNMVAMLEAAAARVLRRIDPNAAHVLSSTGELCREAFPPAGSPVPTSPLGAGLPAPPLPPERERLIREMYRLYLTGRTLKEVGAAYGIGGERTRQLFHRLRLPRRKPWDSRRAS